MPIGDENQPFRPMAPEDIAKMPPAQKLQAIEGMHHAIFEGCYPHLAPVLTQAWQQLDQKNADRAKGQPPAHRNSIAVFIVHKEDQSLPQEMKDALGELEYGVIAVDRHVWTGGPGAPAWPKEHPYKKKLKQLAKDPPEGKIWVVIAAGNAMTLGLLEPVASAQPGQAGQVAASGGPR